MSRNQQIIGVFLWWISDGGEKKYKQIEKYLIRTDTNTHSDYCMASDDSFAYTWVRVGAAGRSCEGTRNEALSSSRKLGTRC